MIPLLSGWTGKRLAIASLLLTFCLATACQPESVSQWQNFMAQTGLTPQVQAPGARTTPGAMAVPPGVASADPAVAAAVPNQAVALTPTSPTPAAGQAAQTSVPQKPTRSPGTKSTPLPPPPLDLHTTENVLILGTDTQAGDAAWRTDSIMILGLDYQYRRAALLSIPRDMLVEIPDIGWRRINQVDYFGERVLKTEGGGPALFSQVLSETLGIQTQHWVRADMTGFKEFVDIIGGVTVHLDCPYYELYQDDLTKEFFWYSLPAGDVTMNGETAFMFVRLRYINSDSGRSLRQRQFLWALRDQAMSTNLLLKIPELWRLMRNNFATDLTLLEMLEMGNFGLSLDASNVRAGAITVKDLERYITPSGADVLRIADPERIQAIIDGIWDAPPLSTAGQQSDGDGTCPPPPSQLPDYLVLATPTPQADEAAVPITTTETMTSTNETVVDGETETPVEAQSDDAVAANAAPEATPAPIAEATGDPANPTGQEDAASPAATPASVQTPVTVVATAVTTTVSTTVTTTVSTAILEPGIKVEVTNTGGRSIRLRSLPSVTSEVLDAYRAGEVLEIQVPGDDYVTYPVEEDGYRWVRVRAWDGRIGWIAQRYVRPVAGVAGEAAGSVSAQPGEASP